MRLLLPLLLCSCLDASEDGDGDGDGSSRPWSEGADSMVTSPSGAAGEVVNNCGNIDPLAPISTPDEAWARFETVNPGVAQIQSLADALSTRVLETADAGALASCIEVDLNGAFAAWAEGWCDVDDELRWTGGLVIDRSDSYTSILFDDLWVSTSVQLMSLNGRADLLETDELTWWELDLDYAFPDTTSELMPVDLQLLGTAGGTNVAVSSQPLWSTEASWPQEYLFAYHRLDEAMPGIPLGTTCVAAARSTKDSELALLAEALWELRSMEDLPGCFEVTEGGSTDEEPFCPVTEEPAADRTTD